MRAERYSEYKDSGVAWLGEVPKHWKVTSLRHCLADIFNGLTATQIDQSDITVPVTRIETISNGVIDAERLGFISEKEAREDRRLLKGDILFSNINSLKIIGNCAQYLGEETIYAGMNLLVLRPSHGISDSWLLWLIRSSTFRQVVESLAKPAINQASISQQSLLGVIVPVPSFCEQLTIADLLGRKTAKIDTLVEEQKKLIALLKEKRQAIISHAVTKGIDPRVPMKDSGIDWLGEVPEHWKVKRLRFVVRLNPSKSENVHMTVGTEVSFLPMEAIGDDGAINLERSRLISEVSSGYTYFREGDVTIAKITPCFENGKGGVMRGLLGGIGFGTTELIVVRPTPTETTSEYLYWLFMSAPFRKFGESYMYGAGGQKRVPDDFVRDFTIAFAPLLEQLDITSFVDSENRKIDDLVVEAQHAIELLKERRSALISAAVTGKIDVRGLVTEEVTV